MNEDLYRYNMNQLQLLQEVLGNNNSIDNFVNTKYDVFCRISKLYRKYNVQIYFHKSLLKEILKKHSEILE
jgi:hypothetical protein